MFGWMFKHIQNCCVRLPLFKCILILPQFGKTSVMQSQRKAPRSLCATGTADRLNAAGPFPAVCQCWCYSMTVSTSLGMCFFCSPSRTPHMTGPSYDPWKHRGFAPITAAGRWNCGLRALSCLFSSPALPGEWETHLRLLAHSEEAIGVRGRGRCRVLQKGLA